MNLTLNDVHSQLNATTVAEIHHPQTLAELIAAIQSVAGRGLKISVSGGRHAMGGQAFAHASAHIDMTGLCAVISSDSERGLLQIQAGADWPTIIAASHAMEGNWAIRQKQTGVDSVTLGGSISANAHGRGLNMRPISDDIESLSLITAKGESVICSRELNHELFSLVLGGYGLFGIIYSATLRLTRRQRVQRIVDIIDLDDAMNAVFRRASEGCLYGDFQFVIDGNDTGFLRRGVFSCYKPVDDEAEANDTDADLSPERWLELIKLAHEDKRQAFRRYAQHYLTTDGDCYWSDTMQLSTYIPSYADYLEAHRAVNSIEAVKETLIIGEHYVPHEKLLDFMAAARDILRNHGAEVIYGTIRAIQRDLDSFLPWATQELACIVFNIRTRHCPDGIEKSCKTFRALTDASNQLGGRFFLTYHRFATAEQVATAYPTFTDWLKLKKQHDPEELFVSNWYFHYRDAFRSHA